jgi:D-xylose transport system permease protein
MKDLNPRSADIPSTAIGYLRRIQAHLRAYTKVIALLVLWILLTIVSGGIFVEARNLSNLFRQTAIQAYLAMAMVLVIASGNIDLSVGSVVGFSGAMAAMLQIYWLPSIVGSLGLGFLSIGWVSTAVSCLFAVAVGTLVGYWQGIWVAYGRVPAFIVTLGGLLVFRGWILGLTRGINVAPMNRSFQWIGQAYLSPRVGTILLALSLAAIVALSAASRRNRIRYGLAVRPLWTDFAVTAFYCALVLVFVLQMQSYRGIPVPVILVAALAVLFTFLARNTRFGRYCFAIGGNMEAARLSGINIRRITIQVFALMGALAGFSGIVLTARLNAATANAGNLFELNAIAACVIGGTSLMGGEGSIGGAIIGALIMASVDNGLSMMNVEAFWQQVVKGLILMTAVLIDVKSKGR